MYAAISADLFGTLICFIFYLILLLPLLILIEKLKTILYFYGLESTLFINSLLTLVVITIGLLGVFFFAQICYLIVAA